LFREGKTKKRDLTQRERDRSTEAQRRGRGNQRREYEKVAVTGDDAGR